MVKPFRRSDYPVGGRDLDEVAGEARLRASERRRLYWRLIFVAVAATAIVWLRPEVDQQRLVIQPFQNRTEDPNLNRLGDVVAHRLGQQLRPLRSLVVVPERSRLRADLVLTGSYYRDRDSLRVSVVLRRHDSGELVRYFSAPAVPRARALYYAARLAGAVADTIANDYE